MAQAIKCTAEKEVHIYEEFNKISKELGAKFILSWANWDESYHWLRNWARIQQITLCRLAAHFGIGQTKYPCS